jgi:hypothetical protein
MVTDEAGMGAESAGRGIGEGRAYRSRLVIVVLPLRWTHVSIPFIHSKKNNNKARRCGRRGQARLAMAGPGAHQGRGEGARPMSATTWLGWAQETARPAMMGLGAAHTQ